MHEAGRGGVGLTEVPVVPPRRDPPSARTVGSVWPGTRWARVAGTVLWAMVVVVLGPHHWWPRLPHSVSLESCIPCTGVEKVPVPVSCTLALLAPSSPMRGLEKGT